MSFNEAVSSALRSYATFSGRARRSELWWFYLFTFLVGIASSIADAALGLPPRRYTLLALASRDANMATLAHGNYNHDLSVAQRNLECVFSAQCCSTTASSRTSPRSPTPAERPPPGDRDALTLGRARPELFGGLA